ncbi:NUDIX hydrolase [Reyranella sp. CPCC 100927]|uniref:NUDIX hydrolase n=1 Tax=Reyranella sp. CPCC 100927 TaxID=2599616 RepID=UPI0011B82451|nr:NUDIX hydrolase [Reyranella sp. CPCC 100927]TWT05062.1 NUDIX hydrolase [Reyranella sp. CPCC 100927]
MSEKKPPVTPVPATTVLLLRPSVDGDPASTPEVFMVVRHHQIDFASGALVFPGGKVDAADSDPRLRDLCTGIDGASDAELAFRVAGIREAFEETGVLLARRRGAADLIAAAALKPIEDRYRQAMVKGEVTMADMARVENLVLACDTMLPYAHWITPTFVPKRFDTRFFVAAAPSDQVALHDGHESVDSVWIQPAQAIADAEAGHRTMLFPTKLNLMKLAEIPTVAALLAHYGSYLPKPILPIVEVRDGRRFLTVGKESGYALFEREMDASFRG